MITAALRISLRGSFCPHLAWIFNHRPGQLQCRLISFLRYTVYAEADILLFICLPHLLQQNIQNTSAVTFLQTVLSMHQNNANDFLILCLSTVQQTQEKAHLWVLPFLMRENIPPRCSLSCKNRPAKAHAFLSAL